MYISKFPLWNTLLFRLTVKHASRHFSFEAMSLAMFNFVSTLISTFLQKSNISTSVGFIIDSFSDIETLRSISITPIVNPTVDSTYIIIFRYILTTSTKFFNFDIKSYIFTPLVPLRYLFSKSKPCSDVNANMGVNMELLDCFRVLILVILTHVAILMIYDWIYWKSTPLPFW